MILFYEKFWRDIFKYTSSGEISEDDFVLKYYAETQAAFNEAVYAYILKLSKESTSGEKYVRVLDYFDSLLDDPEEFESEEDLNLPGNVKETVFSLFDDDEIISFVEYQVHLRLMKLLTALILDAGEENGDKIKKVLGKYLDEYEKNSGMKEVKEKEMKNMINKMFEQKSD